MTDHDDAQHRQTFQASGDAVSVRDVDREDIDGMFAIRMPVSSTAEARDGEAFSRDRLDAFARQIADGDVGVFLDHGRSGLGDSRYSALGKVGYWANAEVADRDAGADLVADAVLMDPSELDAAVGEVREALATLKAQAEMGVPLASSVGWSEDVGDRDVPGDADLLEISIVGIPSDPRTTTASADAATMARAVAAASADFDVETFVREVESRVRKVVEVGDEEVDLTPPDAVQTAATVGLAKDDELEPDCGTGAGRESARQIASDDVTAARIDDIAAYLTSHEEDVSADGPPSDWSDEEWQDCGNLQYALWGGTGTGTGLEWAQRKANEVAAALGDELPYPERADRTPDDNETDTNMTDSNEPDEESGDDADEQTRGMEEMMSEMVELQREQTDMIREMHEKQNGDGEDDEDGDMEEESADVDADTDADPDEGDRDADPETERTITVDGEELSPDEVREHVADLRDQASEAEAEAPATQDRAEEPADDERDADSEATDSDTTTGFGMTARTE